MPPTEINPVVSRVEDSRMSFGDHLEELRRRVILALIGLFITTTVCMTFGDHIISFIGAPYRVAMEMNHLDPHMIQIAPSEAFMEYFTLCMQIAFVLAMPWILYQIWKFVEAGLYPAERRVVRMFAPASIILFLAGASFMLVFVLTGLMNFLISVSSWFPMPGENNPLYKFLEPKHAIVQSVDSQPSSPPLQVPTVQDDPTHPGDGQVWFNVQSRRLVLHTNGDNYSLKLQKTEEDSLVQPFFSLEEYLGFVINLALAFGLGFQIPIVVVFLISVSLVTASQFSAIRKFVILGVAIAAAVLTPSPDVGTMMLLAVPMYALYEIGLFIGKIVERRRAAHPAE